MNPIPDDATDDLASEWRDLYFATARQLKRLQARLDRASAPSGPGVYWPTEKARKALDEARGAPS